MPELTSYLRLFFLLACGLGSLPVSFAQKNQEHSGQYMADFLPERLISSIFQDRQGYLWVGSQNGLYQYDGDAFRTFAHRPEDSLSLSEDIVWTIAEDHEGFLWVGTETGLNRYDKRMERFEQVGSLNGSIFQEKITAICEDHNHQLWVGTEAGLFQLNKKTATLLPFDVGNLNQTASVKVIFEDQAHSLWVGTETRGVFRLTASGKALQQFTQSSEGLQSDAINHILETQKGQIFVGTDFGFALFDSKKNAFQSQNIPDPLGEILGRSQIEAIVEDSRGKLWIGTFDNDLFRYDITEDQLERFSQFTSGADSANKDPINSLLVDKTGVLWIGTYLGGLHAFLSQEKKFDLFRRAGNSSTEVYAVFEDADEQLWLGTANGLEVYDSAGKLIKQSKDEVTAILPDHQGNTWVGTLGSGLKKLSKGSKWPPTSVPIDLPPDDFSLLSGINDLLEDRQQQIWIATLEGITVVDANARVIARYDADPTDSLSLSDEEVHTLFIDKSGKVWVGTDEGLNYFDQGFYRLNLPDDAGDALNQSAVYAITEDSPGNLWIASAAGLIQISPDKKRARLIKSTNPEVKSLLYGLLFDAAGELWASSEKGLWRVKTADFSEEISMVTYMAQEGELSNDAFNFGAYFRTSDDRLIFGCQGGAVIFRPEEVWQNAFPPPAVIHSFQIGLEEVDFRDPESPLKQHISYTKRIVLDPGLYRITLGFTALNFIFPEANRYRYRMDKVDKNWIYDRGNKLAEYPLRSGNYVFHLQAANNDGIWNTTDTELEIVILRPFTETIWFYLICLLLLAGAVVGFVRFRTRQLEQTQRKLEEKVAERTEEVNKKNEALELTLDELKEAQTQLVEQEKMASLGQLTAGVAHEINNPITFVSGNITPLKRDISEMMDILRGYEEEVESQGLTEKFERIAKLKDKLDYEFLIQEIKQLLEGISEGAERTAEIVRGLRNFSRLDEDVLKLANVNQGIESTLLLLRSELKDRIEIVKDMPDMPDIMCYPGKLNGVYMNILTNAMQAINGPGKIFITTRHHGGHVKISIRDTGPGMPEEVQKRIFEPFFTTKDVGFGTGLGLSITYGAIEQHKGKITVKSRMGEGTEFVIVLPVG